MIKKSKRKTSDAFRYDFTLPELMTFLFHSKKCPVCSGTLRKEKTYEIAEGKELNGKGDPFFISNAKVKHYLYRFHCDACGKVFTLQDLTGR